MEEVTDFIVSADRYQKQYSKERSKMTLSLIKQAKRYSKKREDAVAELQTEINAIRVKHASVDEKENIIEQKFDVKQGKGDDNSILRMAYKKEAQNKMIKEIEELTNAFDKTEIEILPPYANSPFFVPIPDGFDFNYLDAFKKFIFNPEISEEEEERIYLSYKPEQKPTVQSVLN